jgi:hypothetical protein
MMDAGPSGSLDGGGPWSYYRRIPVVISSGVMSVVLSLLGVFLPGFGMFLAKDVARGIPFWSNWVVLFGVALMLGCFAVAIWMHFGKWLWTSPQLGTLGVLSFVSFLYGLVLAPLLSSVFYSQASFFAKCLLAAPLLLFHITWVRKIAHSCWAVINDEVAYKRVWVFYPGIATIFSRSQAATEVERKGFTSTPSALFIVVPFILIVPMYFFGRELTVFFDMPLVPLMLLVMGSGVCLLFTSVLVLSIIMHFIIPARIVGATDLPVLVSWMDSDESSLSSRKSRKGASQEDDSEFTDDRNGIS